MVNAAAETMYKIVRGIMEYAPIGVFFLIAMVFVQQAPRRSAHLRDADRSHRAAVHLVVCYGGIMAVAGLGFLFQGANDK